MAAVFLLTCDRTIQSFDQIVFDLYFSSSKPLLGRENNIKFQLIENY